MTAVSLEGWYDPDATTFGDRVAGAREQAGMSQAQLAKRLGIKKKTLEEWENDHSEPRANRLSMMAGLMNVTITWLLTGQGEGPGDPEGASLSREASELLSEVREISVQMRLASERLNRVEKELQTLLREPEIA
ncbi:helix-turn-helix domain-containing protein [Pseudohalocynthiibacter aestuariivivens]|uniref:Helix-turn-helix domain-containing protein n=1 Tax=Roseovarius pelagicus TaxID=2980108 RepID=A0ABY6DGA6_9RHOB|nr:MULTISPECIES: helix-turn-helix domain-containing protein [Rhodobacterales]QIE47456.1 helix-turn-helix domain-containing protein [Pseudohalocynthiibacter aestuariivivens]UXX85202.1 helix-turn-helix domain-containing protein [Roseovarius pelagicus]